MKSSGETFKKVYATIQSDKFKEIQKQAIKFLFENFEELDLKDDNELMAYTLDVMDYLSGSIRAEGLYYAVTELSKNK